MGLSGGQRRAGDRGYDGTGGGSASCEELLWAAVASWRVDPARHAVLMDALADQLGSARVTSEMMLDAAVARLWERGWTPADLVHVVTHQLTAAHTGLAAAAVVADGRRRAERGEALHPCWQDQLARLDGQCRTAASHEQERLRLIVDVLGLTSQLPGIPTTVPPPGAAWSARTPPAHLDARVLERVRALLAKAESTAFEAEAEALTTKAQELIARHAIDEALLHEEVGEPSVRRIPVDRPYADAKAILFDEVARANRCRVVHTPTLGWVTAFGCDRDLDAVELLTASLLAQATAAMVRQGPQRDAFGRSRTRSFRRAFLVGFAQRIGERLLEAADGQLPTDAAEAARLLPVLAARADRLRAASEAAFPALVERTTTVRNPAGWYEGRAAAELASLGLAPHRLPGE